MTARRHGGSRHLELAVDQAADEVVEPDVLIVMALDPEIFAGRVDALRRIELGRPDSQVDVGQEAAEHEQAVGRFDQLGHLGPAHGPLVNAAEKGMGLGDHALAQERRRDRHSGRLGESQELVLQAESMDLDVGQDHRPPGGRQRARPPRRSPRAAHRGRWEAAPPAAGAAPTCRAFTWSRGSSR